MDVKRFFSAALAASIGTLANRVPCDRALHRAACI
jgi:hypothetical protein